MKLKSTYFKGLGALAMIAGMATTANALTLDVPQHGNWQWHEIFLENGPRYIFQVNEEEYWNEETDQWEYKVSDEAFLWRVEGGGEYYNLELPSQIIITPYSDPTPKTVTVTSLGFPYDHSEIWDCQNMVVTIPKTYTQINDIRYDTFSGITLESATPPELVNCGSNIVFRVSDEAYNTYLDYVAKDLNGWGNEQVRSLNPEWITVNTKSNNLEDTLLANSKVNGNLENIVNLKITGEINGRDMNIFTDMRFLENLDLSGVTVVSSEREDQYIRGLSNLRYLESVVLPTSITTIENDAFNSCPSLKSINLGNVTRINAGAFAHCRSLETVDLRNVTRIDSYSFENCYALDNLNLANIQYLGYYAFVNNRSLRNITLSDSLISLDGYVFADCYNLENLKLPKNAYLGHRCFSNTKIKEISYYHRNNVQGDTFAGMPYLTDVYCYDPIPTQSWFELSGTTNLYVPAFAIDAFSDNSYYEKYRHIYELDDVVDYLDVPVGFEINSTKGLADGFDLNIAREGYFVNNSGNDLSIGNFTQVTRFAASTNYGFQDSRMNSSYFLSDSKTTAKNVEVSVALVNSRYWRSDSWNFISFPYDVNLSDIVTPDETQWVVREYDGAARASNPEGESKWVNASGTLKGGKGYILHFSAENYEENIWHNGYDYYFNYFKFPAANETRNNLFNYEDVTVNLNYYNSAFDHNKSWNLIGNPYDTYYDIEGIEYSNASGVSRVPITVWRCINGSYTYEAFSADDDYVLRPFEAFFVQGIDQDNLKLKFNKDGRVTSDIETRTLTRASDPVEGTSRSIFNLHLTNDKSSDRTRLVINENASVAYEISCDASKFLSSDDQAAQIYMIENKEMLAINERPFGNGAYKLGFRVPEEGIYTISLDTRNAAGFKVSLFDMETGKEIDLNAGEYSFSAKTSDDDRFMLKLSKVGSSDEGSDSDMAGVTGVDNASASISIEGQNLTVSAQGSIEVYTIDGKVGASGINTLNVTLPQGMYIIKTAEESVKAVIR